VDVLGPVRAEVDGQDRTPAGKRDRALLALLALRPGQAVTADEVADGLWGSLAPPDRETAVLALVTRIAGDLGVDRIEVGPDGLRLAVDDEEVDALAFLALVERARAAEPDVALATLDTALGLWRGEALEDVADVPFARAAVADLTERRLGALEERVEALLALGRAGEVVDGLREDTRRHPTRERLWGQLMTALHRESRTQEALEVYAEARRVLSDELGIEPGEALQRIEAAILLEEPGRDPALADLPVPRPNGRLPAPRTATIGRELLVDQVVDLFRSGTARLVMLSGLGGSGKTRLAVVVAARLRELSGREVYFHEVIARESADQLVALVEQLVGETDPDLPVDGWPLVVLDNLDASLEAAAAVATLAADHPGLALLVTSRVPLRLGAEHAVAVPPLAVPLPGATPADVAASPAVALFTRAARQGDPSFVLDGHEDAVGEICRLLDGLPLALELAAARVRLLGVDGLSASLATGLELLRTTSPDVPERQRALASIIAWSHERLADEARRLCRRLVVFERAFTLEAAEAVAVDVPDVVEGLAQVMEAGLIRPMNSRVRIGFQMPAPVRSYLRSLVAGDAAEQDVARLALAAYLRADVTRWREELDRPEGDLALGRFLDVGDDVHASIEASLRLGRIQDGADLTLAAGPFWVAAGELRQGLARCVDTLRYVPGDSVPAGRLEALAGELAYHLTDYDEAVSHFTRAIAVGEQHRDEGTVAISQCLMGTSLVMSGETERGSELVRVGAEAAQRLGAYPAVATALSVLAISYAVAGDYDSERRTHLTRLAVTREHGDIARTADALSILAEIALDEADADTARSYAEEALAIAHPALPMEAREALITLARAELVVGDLAAGAETLGRAFEASEKIGQTLAIAQSYRVAGCLAAATGRAAEAVRLFAAAQRLAPSPNGTDDPPAGDLAGGLAAARAALGPERAPAEWTLGTSLSRARLREMIVALVTTRAPV
jgi:predicted ATPase/DNA-binding SARP family transcriptional activator